MQSAELAFPTTLTLQGAPVMIFSKNNTPQGFYVYAYLDDNNLPYYIGKGTAKRAWRKNIKETQPPCSDKNIIILEHNLSELGAFAIERRMIRWYGRKDNSTGILLNLTDGGEGMSGRMHTAATRQKMSATRKGRQHSDKHALAISKASVGKKGTNLGKTFTAEHKAKISAAHIGKTFSNETRTKMSDAKKGKIPWNKGLTFK